MPKAAIPMFEAALRSANERVKARLGNVVGKDINAFLEAQRDRIRADAQEMYARYHSDRQLSEYTVDDILEELKRRLGPTVGERLIPTVSYASVVFNPHQATGWGSPWSQALALLESIIRLPRETMPKPTPDASVLPVRSELSVAMDVLEDPIFTEYGTKKGLVRATNELQCLDDLLEIDEADDRTICEAIWTLMATGSCETARDVINSSIP
jgi:hypothetical protein